MPTATTVTFEVSPLVPDTAPDPAQASGLQATHRTLTGLAVVNDGRWIAVCRELGTVAEGDTADAALDALVAEVRDVVEIAASEGLEPGFPVPAEEVRQMIMEHQAQPGHPAVTLRNFRI